jgi:hypothetical protein
VSNASKHDILHFLGVPADKVRIYNGLDLRLSRRQPEQISGCATGHAHVAVHPLH